VESKIRVKRYKANKGRIKIWSMFKRTDIKLEKVKK